MEDLLQQKEKPSFGNLTVERFRDKDYCMGFLRERCRQPEIMDQPDLSRDKHQHALSSLARINFLSATAGSYLKPLITLQKELGTRTLRILDMASGGGDVARRLRRMATSRGLDWHLAGCDLSPVAIDHARAEAIRAGVEVEYFIHDALSAPPPGSYDAIICSLFLHHLENDEAIRLLELMRQTPGIRLILINDLIRSAMGLFLAHVVGRLLTRSPVVHIDGPLSVRAAFTPAEALALATQAGLTGCHVQRCWPWRWFLSWRAS